MELWSPKINLLKNRRKIFHKKRKSLSDSASNEENTPKAKLVKKSKRGLSDVTGMNVKKNVSSKNKTSDKEYTNKKEKRKCSLKDDDANQSDESVVSNSDSDEDYDDHVHVPDEDYTY